MPRKGIVSRRVQATDPVYGEALVEKFICSMMWAGKKSTAQRVFYGAMDQVAKKTSDDALKILRRPSRTSSRSSRSRRAAWAAPTIRCRWR